MAGATGFVGDRLVRRLAAAGHRVRGGSRHPGPAARRHPAFDWVHHDAQDADSTRRALRGVRTAYYLVHGMADGAGYAAREADAARIFARGAAAAGVERIIYLGGVRPTGPCSVHLQSRLTTGEILRGGAVPALELRAGMIVGAGSASWRICRDVATRLPVMVVPPWLKHRSQPVAIDDVIVALVAAADLSGDGPGVFDLPGPETLRGVDVLRRVARAYGVQTVFVDVPGLPREVAGRGLGVLSGADPALSRELVEGLAADLVATEESLWAHIDHAPMSFADAVATARAQEQAPGLGALLFERAVGKAAAALWARLPAGLSSG